MTNINDEKKQISFVILTWNSSAYIEKCLKSYAQAVENEKISAEFIVVDNGSKDNTLGKLKEIAGHLPEKCCLKVIELLENKGTTVSRNIALKQAQGEFIIICDSDTEFLEGSFQTAMSFLKSNNQAGIIAPCLVYEDGNIQPSVKFFPTFLDKIAKLKKIFLGVPSVGDLYPRFPWEKNHLVDTAISAFWMFEKDLLKSVGYLDEKIFYSPEDIDYSIRVWQAGKQIVFYPTLKIRHKTQQITHVKPFSKIAFTHLLGLLYYYKKHRYFFSRKRLHKRFGINVNEFGEICND